MFTVKWEVPCRRLVGWPLNIFTPTIYLPCPSVKEQRCMDSSAAADESSLRSKGGNTSEYATALAGFAVNESRDVLSFYDVEAQILALYDHLSDLKLEIALQEAGNELPSSNGQEITWRQGIRWHIYNSGRTFTGRRSSYPDQSCRKGLPRSKSSIPT